MNSPSPRQKSIFTASDNQSPRNEFFNNTLEDESSVSHFEPALLSNDQEKKGLEYQRSSGDKQNISTVTSNFTDEIMDISEKEHIPISNQRNSSTDEHFSAYNDLVNFENCHGNNFFSNSNSNADLDIANSYHFYQSSRNLYYWKNQIENNVLDLAVWGSSKDSEMVSRDSASSNGSESVLSLSEEIHQMPYENAFMEKSGIQLTINEHEQNVNYRTISFEESRTADATPFQIFSDASRMENKIGEHVTVISPTARTRLNTSNSFTFHCNSNSSQEEPESNLDQKSAENPKDGGSSVIELNLHSPRESVSFGEIKIPACSPDDVDATPMSRICGHTEDDELLSVTQFLKGKCPLPTTKSRKHYKKSKSVCNMLKVKNQSKQTFLPIFIAELIRTTHPNLHLNISICQKIEIFLRDIIYRIGDEAETLMTLSDRKYFTPRVLKYAIKFCLEHIKSEADAAAGRKTPWMI